MRPVDNMSLVRVAEASRDCETRQSPADVSCETSSTLWLPFPRVDMGNQSMVAPPSAHLGS